MDYQIGIPPLAKTIFRAYDIRGIVGEGLNKDILYTLGLAIGSEAKEQNQTTIVVGRDGRLSGLELVTPLIEGLMATGMHVIDIGQVPTPVLYFSTYFFQIYSGVMLTGSHNPSHYNGLKIVLNKKTLTSDSIKALYDRIQNHAFHLGKGSLEQAQIIESYIERITTEIKLSRPFKVVLDAGNGIAGNVAPRLFQALGCEIIPLFCEVDGRFPHHHPDPSEPENLRALIETVLAKKADIGLAFDGDGDRLGVVTNQGKIIWPDRQLMCFAKAVLAENPGRKILFDVKCTRNLEQLISQQGGIPCLSKTGHSLIKSKMIEEEAILAGEMSGHIFFNDKWYGFDDGIYAGARLLDILAKQSLSSDAFFAEFPDSINTPELKLPINELEKFSFIEKLSAIANFSDGVLNRLDGLRVEFKDCWGLIRPSNTSPYLILRFEAESLEALHKIQALFRKQLLAIDASLQLPF